MIEESVESFITQFKPYAAPVEVLPHVEGSPLLECVVGRTVIHLLERTSPYAARPGMGQVIINPTTLGLEPSAEAIKELLAPALSQLKVTGLVLERQEGAVIVDAGVPLVVTLFSDVPETLAAGDWVQFESITPVHGFFVPAARRSPQQRAADADSI